MILIDLGIPIHNRDPGNDVYSAGSMRRGEERSAKTYKRAASTTFSILILVAALEQITSGAVGYTVKA